MPRKEIAKFVLEGIIAVALATTSVIMNERFAKDVSAKVNK